MTTTTMAMTEQEPSRGRKFSILENVVPLRASFLLGRACPKPCWKRVRQAESSSSSDSNPFLGAIFGGIILGIGVGLIIRNGGSLDGSEIVAIIFDKRSTFSVGEIVMALNLIILGAAGFVYSWNSAMYSLIAYFIAYKMIDITITGLDESKGVLIITDAENSKNIADALNANLNRGVTIMYGEGGYLKQPKHVLYSVVTRLEIMRLKNTVYEVDPSAFITIQDVHDVFGGRFTKNGH